MYQMFMLLLQVSDLGAKVKECEGQISLQADHLYSKKTYLNDIEEEIHLKKIPPPIRDVKIFCD